MSKDAELPGGVCPQASPSSKFYLLSANMVRVSQTPNQTNTTFQKAAAKVKASYTHEVENSNGGKITDCPITV